MMFPRRGAWGEDYSRRRRDGPADARGGRRQILAGAVLGASLRRVPVLETMCV